MLKLAVAFVFGMLLTAGVFLTASNSLTSYRCDFWNDAPEISRVYQAVQSGWIIDGTYLNNQVVCLHRPALHFLTSELPAAK